MVSQFAAHQVAGHEMVGAHLAQGGRLGAADVARLGAAAGKFAAGLGVDGAGHVAGQHLGLFLGLFVRVRNGHAGQQRLAVGVQGVDVYKRQG